MTILVGFGPDMPSASGLDLAGRLARLTGEDIVLCCVVHDAWESPAVRDFSGVDDDWRRELRAGAAEALDSAILRLGGDLSITSVVRTGRSVPRVLAEESEAVGARMVVIGSSNHGPIGRISFGSAGDRLVHSAGTPVAVAPRGYREQRAPVSRLLLAVYPTHRDIALAGPAADWAEQLSAPVRVVTFASRDSSAVGRFAGQDVFPYWREQVERTQRTIGELLAKEGVPVLSPALIIGEGWAPTVDAFDWNPDDLLMVGSSEHGPIAQVFLGSSATRIVRQAPVPVILLPRQ
ncbi:universal stress protein [Millisia brevis]|uniref:universal stress protein n=1 Tax=Millisia brevis TaxID=264148 RepID=UPI00083228D2|nr:universal stress protein [Millisia brevis]